jgi:hypothetical protein
MNMLPFTNAAGNPNIKRRSAGGPGNTASNVSMSCADGFFQAMARSISDRL